MSAVPEPTLTALLIASGTSDDRARARELAEKAGVRWSRALRDPELVKNLRHYDRLLTAAAELEARDPTAAAGLTPARSLGDRIRSGDGELPLEALLAQRFALEQALIQHGDERYLRLKLVELYGEGEGTAITWKSVFGEEVPPLLLGDAGGATAEDPHHTVRGRLAWVMLLKETQDLDRRARRRLKHRVLYTVVLPALVVAALALAVAIGVVMEGEGEFLLAGAAGAAGAAMGGVIRLRDEIRRGTAVREFGPFFLGGLVVGVLAGFVAFLVTESEVLEVAGGAAGTALLGFALGFSEAAFLGLLDRLRPDADDEDAAPKG